MENKYSNIIIVEILRRQYLQAVPVNKVSFELLSHPLPPNIQKDIFGAILDNDEIPRPHAAYSAKFLKLLISQLENALGENEELDENLLNLYTDMLMSPKESNMEVAQKPSYVTYLIPKKEDVQYPYITLQEKRSVLSSGGHTGSRTWEAALALGEYICGLQTNILKDKSVIELGAGTGFLSILSYRLCANLVLATDGDSEVCQSIRENVKINKFEDDKCNIKVQELVWGEISESVASKSSWDFVLAADVTYDSRVLRDLVKTIVSLLSTKKTSQAIIASTVRNQETIDEFERLCANEEKIFLSCDIWKPETTIWYYQTTVPIHIYTLKWLE